MGELAGHDATLTPSEAGEGGVRLKCGRCRVAQGRPQEAVGESLNHSWPSQIEVGLGVLDTGGASPWEVWP